MLGGFIVSAVFVVWIFQQRNAKAPIMSFRNMDVRQAVVGYIAILAASIPARGFVVLPLLLQTPARIRLGHGVPPSSEHLCPARNAPGSALGYVWTRWGLHHLGRSEGTRGISGIAEQYVIMYVCFVRACMLSRCSSTRAPQLAVHQARTIAQLTGIALKTCKTQTGAILSYCWARAHEMALMVQDLESNCYCSLLGSV